MATTTKSIHLPSGSSFPAQHDMQKTQVPGLPTLHSRDPNSQQSILSHAISKKPVTTEETRQLFERGKSAQTDAIIFSSTNTTKALPESGSLKKAEATCTGPGNIAAADLDNEMVQILPKPAQMATPAPVDDDQPMNAHAIENDILVTAQIYSDIGTTLLAQGMREEALIHYRKALEIQIGILGKDHIDVAISNKNIGSVLCALGRFSEALAHYRLPLTILEKTPGKEYAALCNDLGSACYGLCRYEDAEKHYRKALAIQEKVLGNEHPATAVANHNIAKALKAQGKHEQALAFHEISLEIRKKVLGTEHVDTASSYEEIGLLLHEQQKFAEARDAYQSALTIRERILGESHAETATSYGNMGLVLEDLGQSAQALDYLRKALACARISNSPAAGSYKAIVEALSGEKVRG